MNWDAVTGVVKIVAAVVRGIQRVTARKHRSVDEIVRDMERTRQRQRAELDTGPIPGEKTPAERPSKIPRGLQ